MTTTTTTTITAPLMQHSTSNNLQATSTTSLTTNTNAAVNNNNNNNNNNSKHSKYKKFIELKEREDFLHKLKEFHKLKGTPINNYPTLNGKQIDLYLLYQKVISYGGWEKICEKEKWDEIATQFNIPKSCSNGSHALKIIYIRYLSLYEKVHFFGEDTLVKDDDEDDSRRKFIHILKSVPMTYNNVQHIQNNSSILNGIVNLNGNNLTTNNQASNSSIVISSTINNIFNNDAPKTNSSISNFERLENSLTSGLPNEVDFVFNTILLLSSDDTYSFRINGTNTRLINLILANIGFFGDDIYNYRRLYDQWRVHNNRNFVKFWHDAIETDNNDILEMLPTLYNKYLHTLPSQELLNLRQENGMHNVEAQRIEQAMVILNNLSFDENNLDFLAKSTTLFQYLIMCSYCTYSDIRKLSLDILANISQKVVLKNLSNVDLKRLFYTIKKFLMSNDRYEIIRGLEIITKLCLTNDNEELLTINLDNDIYNIINELLTVQDFLLLTYGLECLYQLSQFSEILCNQLITSSKSIISLLISYLTVDSSYFQTGSLKMVEIKQPANYLKSTLNPAVTFIQSPSSTNKVSNFTYQTSGNHAHLNNHSHQNIVNSINSTISIPIIQSSQQINANLQEQQAKLSLCNWLKNCFALNPTCQISKTELYCYYKYIAKVNNWIVFPISTFFELLQQSFPQLKTDETTNMINGLKLVVNNVQTNGPVSNNKQQNTNQSQIQPQVIQATIPVNNLIVNQPQQQIQIIKQQQYPQQVSSPNHVIIAAPMNQQPVTNNLSNLLKDNKASQENSTSKQQQQQTNHVSNHVNDATVAKTLQLNINESSSSSSVSSISSTSTSTTSNCPSILKDQRKDSCDDELNNIKENINFTKLNEKLNNTKLENEEDDVDLGSNKTTKNLLDKLEKVGEAEPALNILCNNKNIKFSKIERLVNEATLIKNTNGISSDNEETTKPEVNNKTLNNHHNSTSNENHVNNLTSKINGKSESQTQTLTNGHSNHNDENDSEKITIKTEETISTITTFNDNNNNNIPTSGTSTTTIVSTTTTTIKTDTVDNEIKNEQISNKSESITASTTYINGYTNKSIAINGKIINKTEVTSNNLLNDTFDNKSEKVCHETNGNNVQSSNNKKRKKSTDSSKNSVVSSHSEENVGSTTTPVKKRQKKINEMDIPNNVNNMKSDSNSSINKILVNNVTSSNDQNHIQQQQQQQNIVIACQPSTNNINGNNSQIAQALNSNTPTIFIQTAAQPSTFLQQTLNNSNEYLCEWNNCRKSFANAKAVYNHVFKCHLINLINTDNSNLINHQDNGYYCLWSGCDQTKRQKWALISHLQERHCTEQALRNALICRQKNLIVQTNTPPINPHVAYSKDAAFLAIYRSQRPASEDFIRPEDVSIAKSIRLLAALCLRNLATNSPLARRYLRQYESFLSNIAFDLLEISNAIANCLWQVTH